MSNQFVWPSDRARAENDELNRVCEYLESVLDQAGATPKGNVALMGDVKDEDGTTYHKALVVQFATVEDFHAAMKAGRCRFTVFGGEV